MILYDYSSATLEAFDINGVVLTIRYDKAEPRRRLEGTLRLAAALRREYRRKYGKMMRFIGNDEESGIEAMLNWSTTLKRWLDDAETMVRHPELYPLNEVVPLSAFLPDPPLPLP